MIQVVNWPKFQHYKGRRPPWIKLYRDLLEKREWHALSGDASKLLAECWLLAAEYDEGVIPLDVAALAWRLRRNDPVRLLVLLQELVAQGFILLTSDLASTALAARVQDATPETETETEVDTEKEQPQRVEIVEKSGPAYAQPQEFTRFDLHEAAKRECGMGTWGPREVATASSVITSWYGEGRSPGEIFGAIHGARMLVDRHKVEWLPPQRPFGLQALRNTFTLADQGDGKAQRPLFDVALEEYVRADEPKRKRANGGPVHMGDLLSQAMRAQGSAT